MTEKNEKGLTDRLWDSLASVNLAIILFALISLTSIVGTILEQNVEPAKNIEILAKFVGYSSAPTAFRILDAMGFMDMYRSWWFNTLLAFFAANIIICSLDRLPRVLRLVREPQKPIAEDRFGKYPVRREFLLKASAGEARAQVAAALRNLGFKNQSASEEGGAWQAYSQKQAYSRLGVYITHLSVIVIMLGAVIGFFFGFKGYLNIPEGMSYPIAFSRKNVTNQEYNERNMLIDTLLKQDGNMSYAASALGVTNERLEGRLRRLGAEPLGFLVKNEEFEVSFYGNSDMPSEYSSQLVVFDQGREVMRKRIEVNDPLKYRGYTFYQSSYGMMDDQSDFVFLLNARNSSGTTERFDLRLGDSLTIPGTSMTLTLTDFSPALRFDPSGRAFTYDDMMNNPGLQLRVGEGEGSYMKWILKRYPQTWSLPGGHRIELMDVWGAQFTGLQVRRDPGVWIVYLGCMVMAVGLYFAFFMSHRRIWIMVTDGGKSGSRVLVAGTAHKGREGYERSIDRMISLLTEGGK